MVSEEITNELRIELERIIERPKTARARTTDYNAWLRTKLRIQNLRDEGADRAFLDNLWQEVNDAFGEEGDEEAQRELKKRFNQRIKPYFKYRGNNVTLTQLSEDDFNVEAVTLNTKNLKKTWNERRALTEQWVGDMNVMPVISGIARDNILEMLDVVDNQVAREIDKDELESIELLPQELVKGIRNIRLTENRDKMYAYWEKISKLHTKLLLAIRELQQEVEEGGESEVEQLILRLPNQAILGAPNPALSAGKITDPFEQEKRMEGESEADFKIRTDKPKKVITAGKALYLPNYIQEVPAKGIQMLDKGQRIMDWIATMVIGYELKHKIKGPPLPEKSRDFPDLTETSKRRRGGPKTKILEGVPKSGQITPEKLPSQEEWGRARIQTHTETERLPHHVVSEGERKDKTKAWQYLDPIFWDSLNDGLDIPILDWELDDAREFVENAITMARSRNMPANEKALKSKLLRLEKEALKTTSGAEKFHIPLTSWVKDNYSEEGFVDKVDDVTKYTSLFFKLLADILLVARGQERIQMDPEYPLPPMDADTKTPLAAGPPDPYSQGKPVRLRRKREQAGRKAEKRTGFSGEIDAKLKKVVKLLDEYYFIPILGKSSLFIDEILPDFSHSLTGAYDFTTLGLLFSDNPGVKKSAGIGVNLESNYNYADLLLIAQNLKAEISVEKTPNTNDYIIVLDELAQSLSNWSGEKTRSAQFAADQLHKYLQGKDEVNTISQYKILDMNAKVLFDDWVSGQEENNSVVLEIRSWLKSSRFEALLKQWDDMGINITKRERVRDDILDATSPDKLNNIGKMAGKILEVHDIIRKMQGENVIYGKLPVNDLNAMDYLITKMENKYNVDITTNDILNIVYSYDSFKSLSNNYGLSQNIIYEIKGLCR